MILLRLISWPYFRKHILRTLLTVAGIVLGTRVPIILTNPADSPRTRLASAALAVLLHDADGRLSTEHPIT